MQIHRKKWISMEENDAYHIQLYTSQIALGQIGDIEDVGAKRLVSTTYEC